jgi:WS/DGAT/MGAT family acyltransferase
VAELMAGRLERDRPLWTLHRVAGARPALVWRIHHALADGTMAMRFASEVLWEEAEATRHPSSGPRTLRSLAKRPSEGRRAASSSARTVLGRELQPASSRTPLDARLGRHRAVAFAAVSLADVKRVERAAGEGVTVNDVVLCAVAGGLRRGLLAGVEVPRLRAKVPVSLHHGGDEANRDSFICVDLDIHEADPARRLLAISRESRARKQAADADAIDRFFATLTERSPRAARAAARWAMSPHVFALNVSNVRGPAGALTVLGRPVTAVASLAEVAQRHALRIACVSAAGRMTFGLCADADALPNVAAIAEGIEAELDSLLGQ